MYANRGAVLSIKVPERSGTLLRFEDMSMNNIVKPVLLLLNVSFRILRMYLNDKKLTKRAYMERIRLRVQADGSEMK
jgi:hypothetical protein